MVVVVMMAAMVVVWALLVACSNEKRNLKANSRKSVRWTAVPVPCPCRSCLKLRGKQGSDPKGVDDLCNFHEHQAVMG